ncbi:MAG: Asp-tRNA(Asn)/Glu-tRNA(Gln) amidotransferase subunit GatC [Chloroflexi bacterium]|nr:Asp-tRNA(Asn)/Glu-tRNA(Gln) amidotransferase subunit GatC [Chloroflexota bacterium]
MSALEIKDVEHIAELARLELTEGEKHLFQQQLSAILNYVEQLQEVDTETVEPTYTVLPINTVLRDDVVEFGLTREAALANTEEKEAGMFRVKAILED